MTPKTALVIYRHFQVRSFFPRERKNVKMLFRAETKALIGGGGGGGGAYSYIRVLPDEFLLKSTVMTTDFKRNSSGRTRIYEYTPLPPQLTL